MKEVIQRRNSRISGRLSCLYLPKYLINFEKLCPLIILLQKFINNYSNKYSKYCKKFFRRTVHFGANLFFAFYFSLQTGLLFSSLLCQLIRETKETREMIEK